MAGIRITPPRSTDSTDAPSLCPVLWNSISVMEEKGSSNSARPCILSARVPISMTSESLMNTPMSLPEKAIRKITTMPTSVSAMRTVTRNALRTRLYLPAPWLKPLTG